MAYTLDEDNDGLYEVYIGQNGEVVANPNSKDLFKGFSKLEYLNLNNLNTSNVTSMMNMFEGNTLTTLNLSSFDTSKVTDMSYMFKNASATTGYARTQIDADKFNASNEKPSGLTFVVKS